MNRLFYKATQLTTMIAIMLLFFSFSPISTSDYVSLPEGDTSGIKWMSFEEAVEKNRKNPKKIFIDVYTSWCGWCKVMDKNTFTDPVIIEKMNKYFYAVKLDAEMRDTVRAGGKLYVNAGPAGSRSSHQLAIALLNGKMSYPTTVYLDENINMLSPVPGYMKPADMEPILDFYGENYYKTVSWEEYQKNYKGSVK